MEPSDWDLPKNQAKSEFYLKISQTFSIHAAINASALTIEKSHK